MEIKAKLKDSNEVVAVQYDIPQDLDGLVAKFGADIVASNAIDSLVISVQALVRRHMRPTVDKAGKVTSPAKSAAEIQAIVNAYKPGTGTVRRTPVEKIGDLISQMTPEQKADLLKSLSKK